MRQQAVKRSRTSPARRRTDTRRTLKQWGWLLLACAIYATSAAISIAIVYTIATVSSGWWIPGGLPWTH